MSYTMFADVATEAPIPQNGILSRVLFKSDQIRVVVFAFDAGQELTEHTAARPALVEIVSGRVEVALAGDLAELKPGSWLHMPAQLPHSVRALDPTVMLLTLLPG